MPYADPELARLRSKWIHVFHKDCGCVNKQNKRAACRKSYRKHKDVISDNRKQKYWENPEKYRAPSREYSRKYPEKKKAYWDKWYPDNKESLSLSRKQSWGRKWPKRYAQVKARLKSDPLFRLRNYLGNRLRSAVVSKGNKKMESVVAFLGCDVLFLRSYLEQRFKPGMTWENYGRGGWHVDHVIPCASFDLSDLDGQRRCFHYTNLQPLWQDENLSKNCHVPAKHQFELL